MATLDFSYESLLLKLPPELLEKSLSFLTFEDICSIRLVCKSIDKASQQVLNHGFSNAEKLHGQIYKEIKAKLPRRESERRNHALARHMDLLAALETRLSLLAMTYIKYMEMEMCCFIPGRVLDEIYHILYRIRNDQTPPRPHELLTELRDISSMAMEHFEEKIVPILRGRIRTEEAEINNGAGEYSGGLPDQQATAGGFQLSESPSSPVMNTRVPPLRVELVQLRNTMRSTSSTVISLRKEVNDYKTIVSDQHKKMLEQDKKIMSLTRLSTEMRKKMADQEKTLLDLRNSVLCLQMKSETNSLKSVEEMVDSGDRVVTSDCDDEPGLSGCSECAVCPTKEHLITGCVPSPDSIDPRSANLKTLLTVLDAAPAHTVMDPVPVTSRTTRNKRKKLEKSEEISSKATNISQDQPKRQKSK